MCMFETAKTQAYDWHEPYNGRLLRTVLRGTGGVIPPVYSARYRCGQADELSSTVLSKVIQKHTGSMRHVLGSPAGMSVSIRRYMCYRLKLRGTVRGKCVEWTDSDSRELLLKVLVSLKGSALEI
jgi:hypothetical protein